MSQKSLVSLQYKMVSPKKPSSASKLGRNYSGADLGSIAHRHSLSSCCRDVLKQSRRKASVVLLLSVLSWCALSSLYFASVMNRRAVTSTRAITRHLRLSPGDLFSTLPGQRSQSLTAVTEIQNNNKFQVQPNMDSESHLPLPENSGEMPERIVDEGGADDATSEKNVRDHFMKYENIPRDLDYSDKVATSVTDVLIKIRETHETPQHLSDTQSPLNFVVDDTQVSNEVIVELDQEVELVNRGAQEPKELQTPQLQFSPDSAIDDTHTPNEASVEEELFAMEVSIDSDTQQENKLQRSCDLLPLRGGRYFWRNRQRLVDLDETDICGPKVLIIGAKKCGTTNIADMLLRHPRIRFNSCNLKNTMGGCRVGWFQGALKQGKVFDGDDFTHVRRRMSNGWLDEFGKRLPRTDGITTATFDKSPSYMDISFFPEVVDYAKAHLPNAKIVATLCNPAERLYSEFQSLLADPNQGYKHLYWDNGVEPPTDFAAFVNLFHDEGICNEKEGFCDTNRKQYLKQGDFLYNLQPWYDMYGKDNVLVVNMDDEPSDIVKSLLRHVGNDLLPDSEYPWHQVAERFTSNVNEEYEGRASSYHNFNEEMKWLEEYYASPNEKLAVQLEEDWPRKWNCRLNGDCGRFSW
jgi:hypothetical protein